MEGRIRRTVLHREIQHAVWTLIAATILVAVCFANSLPNDFILDDYQIVAVNPAIRSITPLRFLMTPYWGENTNSGIYRPLTIFSFSLEYPLWHRWAGGYRLTNLVLHLINGFLLFVIARSLLQSLPAAWAASAIFLVHPAHTEPVVGLVGRGELLAAMFFLLAWMFFRQKRTTLCAASFFLSLLSKENAIAFPAVIVLDTLIAEGSIRKLPAQWKRFVPVAAVAVSYLGLRWWVLGGLGVPRFEQYINGAWTFSERILTSGRVFLKYFQLLLAPVNVTGDYDFNSIPLAHAGDWVAWAGLALVATTVLLGVRMLKTRPVVGFGILFFYVTMLPVSNWIVPTALTMSERSLYLPSVGVCLIVAMIWGTISSLGARRILAAGVLAMAALLCISHNYIWRGDLTFFGNIVRVLPDNTRGRQGYGVALVEAGRPEEARQQFEAGLRIKRNAPLLVGLAEALIQIDRGCVRARGVLDEALTVNSVDPFARWLLGGCYEREGDIQKAEAAYRQAVNDAPFPDPKLLVDWGRALQKAGRPVEAKDAFNRAALLK